MAHREELELDVDLEERGSLAPFLFGVLVGAGAALLLAPAAGAVTRSQVARLLGRAGERGPRGSVDAARSAATSLVDRARGAVDGQVGRVRDAVEEGRAAARQTGEELRRTLDEAKAMYRAGVAGTPPPPAPRPGVAPPSAAEPTVEITGGPVEEGRGDLAP